MTASQNHRKRIDAITAAATTQADGLWAQVDVQDLDATWGLVAPAAARLVGAGQVAAASQAEGYVDGVHRENRASRNSFGRVNPEAWRHLTAGGLAVGTYLYGAVARTKSLIGQGHPPAEAWRSGRKLFGNMTITATADAGRMATTTAMVASPRVRGYLRQVNAGACDRCIILAGSWWGLEDAFKRHPGCNCFNEPLLDEMDEEPQQSPHDVFDAMTAEQQDATFGQANAQAIRDGSDIYQVVNAHRKGSTYAIGEDGRMRSGRGFTTEGTHRRRGWYGRTSNAPRMTPEMIYKTAGGNRERALELLRQYRYIS